MAMAAGMHLLLRAAGQDSARRMARHVLARTLAADAGELKRTVLYDFHTELGGKMVPFAGYAMPVQYKDSIIESTKHCRTGTSIFDVSHMCGVRLQGKDALRFIESVVVGDIAALKDGTGTLSVIPNERGGIIDDTVVTKVSDEHIYLVVNAGCREKDLAHFNKHLASFDGECAMHVYDERALLAVQGPKAKIAVQKLAPGVDLSKKYFSDFFEAEVGGYPCYVTRTGYTGEDGFEISVPNEGAVDMCKKLLAIDEADVRMAGLGARDALRLEAGLCLYGNDLDEDTTPIEAGLTWTIGKRRREKCDFVGGEVIKDQLENKDRVTERRVGILAEGAPPRNGAIVKSVDGTQVGYVTSGAVSPVLGKNVAMGYVQKAYAKAGTELKVVVRNKESNAVVAKMPFVPTSYYRPE